MSVILAKSLQEQVLKNANDIDELKNRGGGGGGTDYTAGAGIDITDGIISVDATTVPFKTDLATVATTGDYDDLTNKPTIPHAVAAGNGLNLTTGTTLDTMSVDDSYIEYVVEDNLTVDGNDNITAVYGYPVIQTTPLTSLVTGDYTLAGVSYGGNTYKVPKTNVYVHYINLRINATYKGYIDCTLITNDATPFTFSTLQSYILNNSIKVAATGKYNDGYITTDVIELRTDIPEGLTTPYLGYVGYDSYYDSPDLPGYYPIANTVTVTDTVITL